MWIGGNDCLIKQFELKHSETLSLSLDLFVCPQGFQDSFIILLLDIIIIIYYLIFALLIVYII